MKLSNNLNRLLYNNVDDMQAVYDVLMDDYSYSHLHAYRTVNTMNNMLHYRV